MKIKICFNNEIHKVSNTPATLEDLIRLAGSLFQSRLPQTWALQYVDSDGDNILITDEKDYEEFRNSEQDVDTITKVHVICMEELRNEGEVVIVENDNNGSSEEEEEYQVIQKEEKVDVLPQSVEAMKNKIEFLTEKHKSYAEEKKEPESTDSAKNKVCVDVNVLEKLVAAMIDKNLSKITEEIDKQKSSAILSQNESLLSLEEQSQGEKVTHNGVKCDGCEMMPIVGVRYKCQNCPCFNYCEKCEKTSEHIHHNFVKMKQEDIWDFLFPPLSNNNELKKSDRIPYMKQPNAFEFFRSQTNSEPEEKSYTEEKEPTTSTEATEATYYDNLMEKVKKLLKCFPKAKFDMLCVYVNEAPEDMTLEELIENYKH